MPLTPEKRANAAESISQRLGVGRKRLHIDYQSVHTVEGDIAARPARTLGTFSPGGKPRGGIICEGRL